MAHNTIYVSPSVLKVHPRNQEFFDDIGGAEYERFRTSIREDGILQPLIVSSDMVVLAGHQRLKAALDEKFPLVPINIKDDVQAEDDKLRILFASNFGRAKNDPIKQARVYAEYERLRGVRQGSSGRVALDRDNPRPTQEQIAAELGTTSPSIRNLKSLLKLEPAMQELISDGKISPTTGFKLIAKLSLEEQKQLVSMFPEDFRLSNTDIEKYIAVLKQKNIQIDAINKENADMERRLEKATQKNFELEETIQVKAKALAQNMVSTDIEGRKVAEARYRQEYEHNVKLREQLDKQREELEKATRSNDALKQALVHATDRTPGNLMAFCDDIIQQVAAYGASDAFGAALDDSNILAVAGKVKAAAAALKGLQDLVKRDSAKQQAI